MNENRREERVKNIERKIRRKRRGRSRDMEEGIRERKIVEHLR